MIERANTKDVLAASLIELSRTEPIDKITIQDICDNCSVGRTTFYYHFRDKYELIAWIYGQSIHAVIDVFSRKDDTVEMLMNYIREFESHADYYTNALRHTKDDDFFIRTLYETTMRIVDDRLESQGMVIDDKLRFTISFDIRLAIWSIIDWCVSGKPCTERELAELIYGSFDEGVKAFLLDD